MELLWRRTLADAGERLYCLVNADLLDYDVSQKAVDCLHTLMQDYPCNESNLLVYFTFLFHWLVFLLVSQWSVLVRSFVRSFVS